MSTKLLFPLVLTILLTGCFGSSKFDATNEATIKNSAREIADGLPEDQREEFGKAIVYFTIGGSDGFKTMMGAAFSGKSAETAETMLAINIQSINGLTGEQILTKYRTSLKEDRLKREKAAAEKEKIDILKKEAQKLLESNKFEDALTKYKAMGEISSGVAAAEEGIAKTTKNMNEFTEKMSYMDKVKITEFTAQRIDTYSKEGIPAVRISLKNTGDRSLDEVKVIVYFKDKNDNIIFEEDFHPVLVSKYSFGGNNKPLKSGYIKEMEKGKYYTIESQLSEWVEGQATAKITDIKFSD